MPHCLIESCGFTTARKSKKHIEYEKETGRTSVRDVSSVFSIPAIITHQGEHTKELTAERRRRWLAAISRADLDTQLRGFVCSWHFRSGVSAPSWDKHNIDWVPTLSLGHNKRDLGSSEAASNRAERTLKRKKYIDEVKKQFEEEKIRSSTTLVI